MKTTGNVTFRGTCAVALVFGLAMVLVKAQYGSKIGCMSAECTFATAILCLSPLAGGDFLTCRLFLFPLIL